VSWKYDSAAVMTREKEKRKNQHKKSTNGPRSKSCPWRAERNASRIVRKIGFVDLSSCQNCLPGLAQVLLHGWAFTSASFFVLMRRAIEAALT
jgi:hypothetical protein